MKIFIDAGHNPSGVDTGAEGNGLREQDVTFAIAQKIKPILEAAGHSVKLSRPTAETRLGSTTMESLQERCRLANEWGAELFVSIHCNAGGGIGTETYVYSATSSAATVARRIQDAVTSRLGTLDRGVKEGPGLAVLRGTSCPAALVETAFIDTASDAALLRNCQDDFAAAIAAGITGDTTQKEDVTVAQTAR